jgi:hypothetical protein
MSKNKSLTIDQSKKINLIAFIGKDLLLSIINEWLRDNFIDIVNFDSALCQLDVRASYLSYNEKTFHGYNVDKDVSTVSLEWTEMRKYKHVSISTMSIINSDGSIDWSIPLFQYNNIIKLNCYLTYYDKTNHGNIWKVLLNILENLPDLINLTLVAIDNGIKKSRINYCVDIETIILRYPKFKLQKVKFQDCSDCISFSFILKILSNKCNGLQSIAFEECGSLNLPDVAQILSSFPSLAELVFCGLGRLTDIHAMHKRYRVKDKNHNEALINYDLPNLRKVYFRNCSVASDVVIAIVASALQRGLEELNIQQFYGSKERCNQLVDLVSSRRVGLNSLVMDDSWYIFKPDCVPQPDLKKFTLLTNHSLQEIDMLVIATSMPSLERIQWNDITVSEQGYYQFIVNSQCFNHLVTLQINGHVNIGHVTLLVLIGKCSMLKNLFINAADQQHSGCFGSLFFLHLILEPNVQKLIKLHVALNHLEHIVTRTQYCKDKILDQLVGSWVFLQLKQFQVSNLLTNKALFDKITKSKRLISCEMYDCLVIDDVDEEEPKLKILSMCANNSDKLRFFRKEGYENIISSSGPDIDSSDDIDTE